VFASTGGMVRFRGEDVTRQRPFEAARRGLARTFQIVQPFPQMTVVENVAAGALFAGGAATRAEAEKLALEQLEFVGLAAIAPRARSPCPPASASSSPRASRCSPRCCCSTK
jgi:branched-chain amino acid transport system ATP-binding protein